MPTITATVKFISSTFSPRRRTRPANRHRSPLQQGLRSKQQRKTMGALRCTPLRTIALGDIHQALGQHVLGSAHLCRVILRRAVGSLAVEQPLQLVTET